jgi:hypothetical protein
MNDLLRMLCITGIWAVAAGAQTSQPAAHPVQREAEVPADGDWSHPSGTAGRDTASTRPARARIHPDLRPVYTGRYTTKLSFKPTKLAQSAVIDDLHLVTADQTARFTVGTDCAIRNSVLDGANHGLRIAYANGMVIENLKARCPGRLGVLKITNLGKPGRPCPPTQNIVIRDSVFEGYSRIAPQNVRYSAYEEIRDVTFESVTFVGSEKSPALVRVTADNVRFIDCTFDMRQSQSGSPTAVWAEHFGAARCGRIVIRGAKVLSREDQQPQLAGGLTERVEVQEPATQPQGQSSASLSADP